MFLRSVLGGVQSLEKSTLSADFLEESNLRMNAPFVELDFPRMADLGFDYAHLPMDYSAGQSVVIIT